MFSAFFYENSSILLCVFLVKVKMHLPYLGENAFAKCLMIKERVLINITRFLYRQQSMIITAHQARFEEEIYG